MKVSIRMPDMAMIPWIGALPNMIGWRKDTMAVAATDRSTDLFRNVSDAGRNDHRFFPAINSPGLTWNLYNTLRKSGVS
jgi:hypothetical protein